MDLDADARNQVIRVRIDNELKFKLTMPVERLQRLSGLIADNMEANDDDDLTVELYTSTRHNLLHLDIMLKLFETGSCTFDTENLPSLLLLMDYLLLENTVQNAFMKQLRMKLSTKELLELYLDLGLESLGQFIDYEFIRWRNKRAFFESEL